MTHLGIDTTAALSMGAETIDDRSEAPDSGPEQGSGLAQMEETIPQKGRRTLKFGGGGDPVDEPPGRPGWGMEWGKRDGRWYLRPIESCAMELAHEAEELADSPPDSVIEDSELNARIKSYADALMEFIYIKRTLNRISARRKLQAEIDDTAWLFCQAAKYQRDAAEKMAWWTRYGKELTDSQRKQLDSLREYGLNNIAEGYVLKRGLSVALECFDAEDRQLDKSGLRPAFTYAESARRVLRTSCAKLTSYFDTRSPQDHQNIQNITDKFEYQDHFYK